MLLAFLILLSAFMLGYSITRRLFASERFAPSLLMGLILFTFTVFFLSSIAGFDSLAIGLSVLASLLVSLFLLRGSNFRSERLPATLFSLDSFAVFSLSFLLLGYASTQAFDFSGGLSVVSQDWAVHLGITNSLAEGNFPPHYPYLSQYPLSYYYFGHLFIASIVKGGIGILPAYTLIVLLLISSTISAFYSITRTLYGSWKAGLLVLLLAFVSTPCSACLINDTAWLSPFFPFSENSGFPLRPLILSYAFNQLPLTFSFLFFAVFLRVFLEIERKDVKFLLMGFLVGTLPMFGPFFFALGFIFLAYGIIFERNSAFMKGAPIAIVLGALQFYLLLSDKAFAATTFKFLRLEFYAHNASFLDLVLFWLQNAGGHILLALLAVYFVKQRPDFVNLFSASALLFILSSFIMVFPDPWANEKLFLPFFILAGIFAAGFIYRIINSKGFLKYAGYLLIMLALLSSAHQFRFFLQPFGIAQQSVGDSATMAACNWMRSNTPQKSVVLSSELLEESGCISVIAGRLAFYSNPYWIRSQGFDEALLLTQRNGILAGDVQLAKKLNVDYILAGTTFEKRISASLRGNLKTVYSENGVTIYEFR